VKSRTTSPTDSSGSVINVEVRPDLLNRVRAELPVEEAISELHQELAAFAELFHANRSNQDQAAWRSVAAVTKCLQDIGLPSEVLIPMLHGAAVIKDASSPRGAGRPKKSALQETSEGMLATVAELSVRSFRDRGIRPYEEPALRDASKRLRGAWGINVPWHRLKEIRNSTNRAVGKNQGGICGLVRDTLLDSSKANTDPEGLLAGLLKIDRAGLYFSE
jgi:hypothetical protein